MHVAHWVALISPAEAITTVLLEATLKKSTPLKDTFFNRNDLIQTIKRVIESAFSVLCILLSPFLFKKRCKCVSFNKLTGCIDKSLKSLILKKTDEKLNFY